MLTPNINPPSSISLDSPPLLNDALQYFSEMVKRAPKDVLSNVVRIVQSVAQPSYSRELARLGLYFCGGFYTQHIAYCDARGLELDPGHLAEFFGHLLTADDRVLFVRHFSILLYLGLGHDFNWVSSEVLRVAPPCSEKELAELEYELFRRAIVASWHETSSLDKAVRCVKGMLDVESWQANFRNRVLFSTTVEAPTEIKKKVSAIRKYANKNWPEIPTAKAPVTMVHSELEPLLDAYRAGITAAGPHSLPVPRWPFSPNTNVELTQRQGMEVAYLLGTIDSDRARDAKKGIERCLRFEVENDPSETAQQENGEVKHEEASVKLQNTSSVESDTNQQAKGKHPLCHAFHDAESQPQDNQIPSHWPQSVETTDLSNNTFNSSLESWSISNIGSSNMASSSHEPSPSSREFSGNSQQYANAEAPGPFNLAQPMAYNKPFMIDGPPMVSTNAGIPGASNTLPIVSQDQLSAAGASSMMQQQLFPAATEPPEEMQLPLSQADMYMLGYEQCLLDQGQDGCGNEDTQMSL